MTPEYYQLDNGQDLYDMFMQMFPERSVLDHLKMVTMEYVYRAGEKNSVPEDKRKVVGVLKRMAELFPGEEGEIVAVERLPEKLIRLWCEANGYGLVPPNKEPIQPIHDIMREVRAIAHPHDLEPCHTVASNQCIAEDAFAPTEEHTPEELTVESKALVHAHIAHTNGTFPSVAQYATPSRDATILQAAISFWEDAHQRSILTDAKALEGIRHTLSASMWAPHIHYWSHAKKLHEELPVLFPVLLPMEW